MALLLIFTSCPQSLREDIHNEGLASCALVGVGSCLELGNRKVRETHSQGALPPEVLL